MSKRFTDKAKWQDPWFRKLSGPAKMLWIYLCDHCDIIGVVELDCKLASSDTDVKITPSHISELGDRVQVIGDGRLFLTKFIPFQYGTLSENCPPHRKIIERAHKLGLTEQPCGRYRYPNATLKDGYTIPTNTPIYKEEDKIREGGVGETGSPVKPLSAFSPPTDDEMKLYGAKIGLPPSEQVKFFNYYESNGWRVGKNPMKNWRASMVNWRTNWQERTGGHQLPLSEAGERKFMNRWGASNPPDRKQFPNDSSYESHFGGWKSFYGKNGEVAE